MKRKNFNRFEAILDQVVKEGICDAEAFIGENITGMWFYQPHVEHVAKKNNITINEGMTYGDFREFLGGNPEIRFVNIEYLLDQPLTHPNFSKDALQKLVDAYPKKKLHLGDYETLSDLLNAIRAPRKKQFDEKLKVHLLELIKKQNPSLRGKSVTNLLNMRITELGFTQDYLDSIGFTLNKNTSLKTLLAFIQKRVDKSCDEALLGCFEKTELV